MKPRWLAWIAGFASLGFGYWLIDTPHTSRELMLAMVAWVLGFWLATGIRRSERFVEPLDFDDPLDPDELLDSEEE